MVDNADVVRTLGRVADLLEIRGENSFKVRAYRMAAARVEGLDEPIADIAERDGGLRGLDGFGPAIADKVAELLATGHLPYLEELEQEIPPTLLAVCELPGVGPRTAATLWKEAGITSMDELEAAARSGALDSVPRMGARTVERILAALDAHRAHGVRTRRPRPQVEALAAALLTSLRALPAVERAEIAGSFRRGGRAVAPEEFGAAMQYFTGSQAHNIRLRARALRMGMLLNEYGVFMIDGNRRVAGETEQGVYEALGLHWVPPDEREHAGDIGLTGASPRRRQARQTTERLTV